MKTKKTITDSTVDPDILAYTVGDDPVLDLALAKWDCMGTAAHVTMLSEMKGLKRPVVTKQEAAKVRKALGRVVAAGLDFLEDNPDAGAPAVREVMESEGVRQAGRMQSLIHYLMDLSSVAPMVGLLGTVVGMLRAFNSVAFDMAKARPMELAGGVGQALITTIAGLCVAIPALIAWAVFRGRVVALVGRLETAVAELAALLPRKGSPE